MQKAMTKELRLAQCEVRYAFERPTAIEIINSITLYIFKQITLQALTHSSQWPYACCVRAYFAA
jgi:hypothetical protein